MTVDTVLSQGFDVAARDRTMGLLKSFRDCIEQHKAEITALQILYSRPYKQRLTETMLKELEQKLRDNHAAWTEDRLWNAFAATAPEKVRAARSRGGFWASACALDPALAAVRQPGSGSLANVIESTLPTGPQRARKDKPHESGYEGCAVFASVEPGYSQRDLQGGRRTHAGRCVGG